jgi:hypothetical protein
VIETSALPLTACEALDEAIAVESKERMFRRDRIRVSSIGGCARRVLAIALGQIEEEFPWEHSEGGHLLEAAAGRRLRIVYPNVEEQVSVPTSAQGTWTHPDVLILLSVSRIQLPGSDRVVPQLNSGLGVQIKSTKRRSILEYKSGIQTRFGIPSSSNLDQALLEWWFWRQAGFCLTHDRIKILGVPERYELLYLAKEDFGKTRVSIPITWNEERARAAAAEFDRRVEALTWGELPECEKPSPDWECARVPKTYDFDGTHEGAPVVCGMYRNCWGCDYQPPAPKPEWSRRHV